MSRCSANDSRTYPRCAPHTHAADPGATSTPCRDATCANAAASSTGSRTHSDSPAEGTTSTRQAGSSVPTIETR